MTTHRDLEIYDVTIIGAGPVGLFGAFYAGLRKMKTRIIDSLPETGGQLSALYPEKLVYDMPGFPEVLARDLANEMTLQGVRFKPKLTLGEKVATLIQNSDGIFEIGTDKGTYLTKSVVVCAGAGAFSPKRLDNPTIEPFEGRGVHYFVTDKSIFADKRLLIVGGGDSALDWARNLEATAESIILIHRRDTFRAHDESIDWLLNYSTVQTKLFWELESLEGYGALQHATIVNNVTGDRERLDIDACLLNIGFHASIGPIRDWDLKLEGSAIVVNSHMESSRAGIYAAGDICTYDGKLKLIATGVGEVCIAVNYAKTFIDPNAKLFPGHSSGMTF